MQSAGAPLPSEVREQLEQRLQIPVFNDYGMTEACPIAMDAFLSGGRVTNSAGRSCGLQIGIMNSSRELLPTGEEGEIAVRGPAVFSGYEDDAEANRNAFHDGWFRTGDLGRLDQDGNLFVTGRLKEMINRGGEKILPGEVDEVFASHPAVLEAAAFPVPHPTLGEDVACAVVLRTGTESQVSAQELRRYATEHLASFKVPHRIHFVDEIPRGELGKPQRWMLAEQLSGRDAASADAGRDQRRAIDSQWRLSSFSMKSGRAFWTARTWALMRTFSKPGATRWRQLICSLKSTNAMTATPALSSEHSLTNLRSRIFAAFVGNSAPPRSIEIQAIYRSSRSARDVPAPDCSALPRHGVEGLSFRRLAKYLQGEMDMSIVRPANTLYSYSLFTFENAAAQSDSAIRQVQP